MGEKVKGHWGECGRKNHCKKMKKGLAFGKKPHII
jgi:hypothetical protein